jgi:hypothetical protein
MASGTLPDGFEVSSGVLRGFSLKTRVFPEELPKNSRRKHDLIASLPRRSRKERLPGSKKFLK